MQNTSEENGRSSWFQFVTQGVFLSINTNWNLTYTTKVVDWVNWLAQVGYAAFGKGVQLISESSYDETEQLSRLNSPIGILATSWW